MSTLEDFIAECETIMEVKHVSPKLVEDYPDLKIYTAKDYQPHRGKGSGND